MANNNGKMHREFWVAKVMDPATPAEALDGQDLSGFTLPPVNLGRFYCRGTNFAGCNFAAGTKLPLVLDGADFTGATVRDVDLAGATLRDVIFRGTRFVGRTTFAGARIYRGTFEGATGLRDEKANWTGAALDGVWSQGALPDHVRAKVTNRPAMKPAALAERESRPGAARPVPVNARAAQESRAAASF